MQHAWDLKFTKHYSQGRAEQKMSFIRSVLRWKDNIKMNLNEIGWALDAARPFLRTAVNLRVPKKVGYFVIRWAAFSFRRRTQSLGVSGWDPSRLSMSKLPQGTWRMICVEVLIDRWQFGMSRLRTLNTEYILARREHAEKTIIGYW
jgi:hypothetical protein